MSDSPEQYCVESHACSLAGQLTILSASGKKEIVAKVLEDLSEADYTLYALVQSKMSKLRDEL